MPLPKFGWKICSYWLFFPALHWEYLLKVTIIMKTNVTYSQPVRRICIPARHWLHVFLSFSLAVPLYCFSLRLRRDSAQSSTACHLLLVWQFFQWWLWLELAPSAAVCGCSAASHQPQARRSTWKTLRTSLNMMGSLKHQLWSRSFPLKSKSWSLMHENTSKNCLSKIR